MRIDHRSPLKTKKVQDSFGYAAGRSQITTYLGEHQQHRLSYKPSPGLKRSHHIQHLQLSSTS